LFQLPISHNGREKGSESEKVRGRARKREGRGEKEERDRGESDERKSVREDKERGAGGGINVTNLTPYSFDKAWSDIECKDTQQ